MINIKSDILYCALCILPSLILINNCNCYIIKSEASNQVAGHDVVAVNSQLRTQSSNQQQANGGNTGNNANGQSISSLSNNQSINAIDNEDSSITPGQLDVESYWLNQRDLFYNATTFNLTRATNLLVGAEYGGRPYHLPYWFDYEMFKNLTDRSFNDTKMALKRHHIYVDNCVGIWKSQALKRLHRPNNFTFIDHAEDWTQNENYNEEWGDISYELSRSELRESPLVRAIRLVREELGNCTRDRDTNYCILLLIDLDERFGPAMKLRYPFEEERYRSLLDIDAAEEAAAEFADSLMSRDGKSSYWLERRQEFFKNTTFSLSDKTKQLVGQNYSSRVYHLPFWFDYEVFKRMVTRINETPQEELKSHHKYMDSCLEIWNDTSTERLGQLEYEAGGITSHVDIPARTCLYHCNPFDYDLTEDELRETPVEKAMRLVQEELDGATDRRRTILLLIELEERFDFPRAKGMRYPFEQPDKSREDFWKYVEDRDKAIADFVKTL